MKLDIREFRETVQYRNIKETGRIISDSNIHLIFYSRKMEEYAKYPNVQIFRLLNVNTQLYIINILGD